MTKEEALIRSILGPSPNNILSFTCAVRHVAELLFVKNVSMDDVQITSAVYEPVALELQRNPRTVARQIERLANLCWNTMDKEQKMRYIGRNLKDISAPRDMLFYLAYYCQFHLSYYELLEKRPDILANI
ncbi:MAG: sporulation initiation factor Spo0A C-terminal domain-containing protein [Eubacteriales bacterium]|nr:sporulation initiation factor Spo0A C-terminal domain-containing protein [Eubacteriales bacterium]